MVKLADALDSGSSGSDSVQVQVLSLAPGLQTKRLQNKKAMKNSLFFMAFLLFERKYNAERKDKALQEKNRGLANVF